MVNREYCLHIIVLTRARAAFVPVRLLHGGCLKLDLLQITLV